MPNIFSRTSLRRCSTIFRRIVTTLRMKLWFPQKSSNTAPHLAAANITPSTLDEREMYPHLFINKPPKTEIPPPRLPALSDEYYDDDQIPTPKPIPEVTVGSILLWGLLKMAVLVPVMWFAFEQYNLYQYWLVGLGVMWLVVVYPAFMQYQRFKTQTHVLETNTLCAKCRHFDKTGHFCTLLDEHVSETYTPCGGESWEAPSSFRDDE
jgi:hypothetical protein